MPQLIINHHNLSHLMPQLIVNHHNLSHLTPQLIINHHNLSHLLPQLIINHHNLSHLMPQLIINHHNLSHLMPQLIVNHHNLSHLMPQKPYTAIHYYKRRGLSSEVLFTAFLPAMPACSIHYTLFTSHHKIVDVAGEEGERCHSDRLCLLVGQLHTVL